MTWTQDTTQTPQHDKICSVMLGLVRESKNVGRKHNSFFETSVFHIINMDTFLTPVRNTCTASNYAEYPPLVSLNSHI